MLSMRISSPFVLAGLALAACASNQVAEPATAARDSQSVCLVGRFGAPFSKPELVDWLTQRGFVVRTHPDQGLAVALVGNDPVNPAGDGFTDVEATDDYRDAVKHGATIIRLSDLAGFSNSWRALGQR